MSWDDLISRVLAREGGWSDHAIDKGGPTNRGVTLKTFAGWRRRDLPLEKLTAAEVKELTDDLRILSEPEARSIYLQRYVKDVGLDRLTSEQLQEVMFDWAVNSGHNPPVKALQRELGVVVDGVLGDKTVEASYLKDGTRLAQRILWARVEFIAGWMRNDKRDADRDGVPDSMENAGGILRRIADIGRGLA